LFEPLRTTESPLKPPPRRTWEDMLARVDEETREVTKTLMDRVLKLGTDIIHSPTGDAYTCFKGKRASESRFLGLFLTQKTLKVRIRTDPATFKDPKKWTGDRVYHWFFPKANEKEFKILAEHQIDYAMELIEQSYALAK